MATSFDTLETVKELEAIGFPQEQAEGMARILRKMESGHDARLATKGDLEALHAATKADLEILRAATKNDLEKLELRLTIKLGAMIGAAAVGLGILMKLL